MSSFYSLNEAANRDKLLSYLGKGIKSIGIISAENPHGKKIGDLGNDRRMHKLELTLRRLGLRFIHVSGKFNGLKERAFVVIDIERKKLLELASKYNQKAVIHGQREKDRMKFRLIDKSTDEPYEEVEKGSHVLIGTRKFRL